MTCGFLSFWCFFFLLAGDFSFKPASLEANLDLPAVACDGSANVLFAPEVFLIDRQVLFSGHSTVVVLVGCVAAARMLLSVYTVSERLKFLYKGLTLTRHLQVASQPVTVSSFLASTHYLHLHEDEI